MSESLFTRVRWREGYDIAEVDAFVERLTATVEDRHVGAPVTVDDIRNVIFQPVRLREGYAIEEVDAFLDQAAQSLSRGAAERPVDQISDSPVGRPVDSRRQHDAPRFSTTKFGEGYDMSEVDDFVDRVMATVNGQPVDRPVTSAEIHKVRFTPVRFRAGYDVQEVDVFLEHAETLLH